MCVHCTVQNCCRQYCTEWPDNFPSYPPDNHCSDDVYFRKGGGQRISQNKWHRFYHRPHALVSPNQQCWSTTVTQAVTFKALHTGRPPYLTDQLQYYQLTRSLRSSGSHQLVKSRHNLSFGCSAFRISAPDIWNSLPTNIREAQSLLTFRRHLKTHYFQSAFSTP